jgi:co-chaperonin GroES (HSP10)|uniref:Co-chaperonin GroES n=1 Tax=uncultured virus TaxID=340016 RepID=A0A221S2Y0_9VIRU|nr:co-chaperonin GroES [uncultured virus]
MNEKVAEKTEKSELDKAFVKNEERVLDPSLLNKSLLERMPEPTGWRVLVLPYRGKGVTEGGIQLVKETVDRESLSTVVAYVLKVGPLAYQESDKYGNRPWCKKGDWVLIGRYAGSRFRLEDDNEVRIINDDDVIGTILDPNDIKSL